MAGRPWFKVKREWYDTASHKRISGDALHLGPLLFYLADPNWDKDGPPEAPILDAGLKEPLTAQQIAEEARWPVRRVTKALAELERVGTLRKREDGAYVLPNFGPHQEHRDARRKRVKRREEKGKEEAGDSAECPTETRPDLPRKSPSASSSASGSEIKSAADLWGQVRVDLIAFGPPKSGRRWPIAPPKGFADLIMGGVAARDMVPFLRRCVDAGLDRKWAWSRKSFSPAVWDRLTEDLAEREKEDEEWG